MNRIDIVDFFEWAHKLSPRRHAALNEAVVDGQDLTLNTLPANSTMIIAPEPIAQFVLKWNRFPQQLRDAVTTREQVFYRQQSFRFDSFTNRCILFAYDKSSSIFTMYTKESGHDLVCSMNMPWQNTFSYVYGRTPQQWHGVMYGIRKTAMQRCQTGLQVMYDPGNWWASHKLGDAWNGQPAPFSIGRLVTPQNDPTAAMHGAQNQQQAQAIANEAPQQQAQNEPIQQNQDNAQPSIADIVNNVCQGNPKGKAVRLLTQIVPKQGGYDLVFNSFGQPPNGQAVVTDQNAVNQTIQQYGVKNVFDSILQQCQAANIQNINVVVQYVPSIAEYQRQLRRR